MVSASLLTPEEAKQIRLDDSHDSGEQRLRSDSNLDRSRFEMPKAKQLTLAFENRPGTFSHVARVLGDAKVNILAFNCGTTGQEGFVHVIVDNANKGKKSLERGGTELYGSGCVTRIVEYRRRPGLFHRKARS
jgi:ACT domain-containing protein